jgi:ABC-type lipoprotein release transport system permease subunit
MEVTVVGVVVTANDLGLNTGFPALLLTPAFFKAHAGDVDAGQVSQFVRLERGQDGILAFRDRATERFGAGGGVLVGDSNAEASGIRNALRLQATAFALLGAVAAAASVLAVAQALARLAAESATDQKSLRSLGMTSGQRTWALLAPVVVVAIGGAALAVAVGVAASPIVPTGLARQVESDKGIKLDLMATGGGAAALCVLVSAAGFVSARRTANLRAPKTAYRETQPIRMPLSAPATVGLGVALGRGSPRTRGPARSATAAAFIGAIGVTAAVTFAASLEHLLGTPRLYGWNYDAVAGAGGDDPSRVDDAVRGLSSDRDVTSLAVNELAFLSIGDETVETFVLNQLRGPRILPTLVAGRASRGADEIILGSTTMSNLGVRLGDRVKVAGNEGPTDLTVVGQGIFPVLGDGTTTDAAAITGETRSGLRLEESGGRMVMISVRPGVDAVAVGGRHTGLRVSAPVPPSDITNLRLVRSTPWLLATFLAALATAATVHALAVSVRAGRQDLAVLRTLGFDRRQVHAAVRWQAAAMVAIGLVAGVPIGLAVGRWTWRLAVRNTGALVEPVVSVVVLVAMVAVAVLLANLASTVPARTAGRMRPTEVLRAG